VIITSSNEDYDAYVSRHGAAFSDDFITFLQQDYNLAYSFVESKKGVQRFHRRQEPWLDANGNGRPNEEDDLAQASLIGFGMPGKLGDDFPPYIANVYRDAEGNIQAEIRHQGGNNAIDKVWAKVYPPNYTEPQEDESDGELNVEEIDIIDFELESGVTGAAFVPTQPYTEFTQLGAYQVLIYARDHNGLSARPFMLEVGRHHLYLPMISR